MADGLVIEPSWVIVVLKSTAAGLGLVLIAFGHRLPRLSNGLFWLLPALGLTMFRLARISYLLAFLAALLLFYALLWLQPRLPRLAMALACVLPLPLLWFAAVYFSGSFYFRPRVAIVGALLGAVAGFLWPRAMLALLAPLMGVALLAWASPIRLTFPRLAVPLMLACAFQFLDLYSRRRQGQWVAPPRPTAREVLRDWQKWAAALSALCLLLVLSAPLATPADALQARRQAVLTAPTIELSPARNFYLTGRARPLALFVPHRSPFGRLAVMLWGRAQAKAIDARRQVKEEGEIALLRRAGQIAALAMAEVPALARPGVNEAEIQDAILAAFRRQGAPRPSFKPIVGSGANATLPHYDRNQSDLQRGFIVVDIGCMYGGYASDMTRTFAIGGSFSPAQQKLHDVVAAAKAASERILKPGVTMRQLDDAARNVIKGAGFGGYFPHSVGHGVGVDVHDPTPKTLAENMVITLEPGIYIPRGSAVDPALWDLGVRIEDTYRVTADGYEILTQSPQGAK